MLRQTCQRPIVVRDSGRSATLDRAGVDDDLVGGHSRDDPVALRDHDGSGISSDLLFETGSDERRARVEQRNGLPLHVRPHQRAVRVVVLKERNQRRGNRDQLLRGDVHVIHAIARDEWQVTLLAAEHELVQEHSLGVHPGVGLGDDRFFFLIGIEPHGFARELSVLHDEIRRLDEPEIVDLRIARKRRDEADVRTFRRFDRAHAPVLRVVHVADFEARALARESTRSKRRQPALVRQFGERVGLIHELRQLRRSEERLNHRADRTRVDEIVERDFFRIGVNRHALLDQTRHAGETDRELIGDQLADRPNATVAEMVDVVDVPSSLVQFHEVANDRDEVLLREDRVLGRHGEPESLIDLVPAHATEVVPLRAEEQALERLLGGLHVWCVARAKQRVDLLQRVLFETRGILRDRVLDQGRFRAARRHEHLDLVHIGFANALDDGVRKRLPDFGNDLARLRVDRIERELAPDRALTTLDRIGLIAQVDRHVGREHLDRFDPLAAEAVQHLLGQLVPFLHQHRRSPGATRARPSPFFVRALGASSGVASPGSADVFGADDRAEDFAHIRTRLSRFLVRSEIADSEEESEDVEFDPMAKGAEERRGGELLLLVDVDVDDVVNVDGELDP